MRWTLALLVALACSGDAKPGGDDDDDGLGETTLVDALCLEDGTYRLTFAADAGSDPMCGQIGLEQQVESDGDEVDTQCDPTCTCDYQPSLATCTADMAVTCESNGVTSSTDCSFSLDGDRIEGSCVVTVEGAMSLTCNYTVSGGLE